MSPVADTSVRPAGGEDAAAMARIQVRAWRDSYASLLPPAVLGQVTSDEAERRYAEHWWNSIEQPPSSHHRALVALEGVTVAGFAAYGPCADEDRWGRTDAELFTLLVAPERRRDGHGSRLLNAVADLLRDDGYQTLSTWVFDDDDAVCGFLESAGWSADGSRRDLDMTAVGFDGLVPQIRLGTRLT